MADINHSTLAGEDIHSPYRSVFADAAARTTYGGTAVAADVGKMYKQADTGGIWELSSIGPAVWEALNDAVTSASLVGTTLTLPRRNGVDLTADLSSLGGGGGAVSSAPSNAYERVALTYAGEFDPTQAYSSGQIVLVTTAQIDNTTSVSWQGNLLMVTRDIPADTYTAPYPAVQIFDAYGVCLLPTGNTNPYVNVDSAATVTPHTDWKPAWPQDTYSVGKKTDYVWQVKELLFPASIAGGNQYLTITPVLAYEYGGHLSMAVAPIRKINEYSSNSDMPVFPIADGTGLFLAESDGAWLDQGPIKVANNGSISQVNSLTDDTAPFWALLPIVRRDVALLCHPPVVVHMPWLTDNIVGIDKLRASSGLPVVGEVWGFDITTHKWLRPADTGYTNDKKTARYIGGGFFYIDPALQGTA